MEGKVKKPPINISEVVGGKPQKGPLTYQGSRGGRSSPLLQVLLPILVAVIISTIVMIQFAAPKKDMVVVNDNIQELVGRLEVEVERIDNIINTMGFYAKKEGVEALVEKKLTPLETQIVDLRKDTEWLIETLRHYRNYEEAEDGGAKP
jgi:signal transduction histidine kinase